MYEMEREQKRIYTFQDFRSNQSVTVAFSEPNEYFVCTCSHTFFLYAIKRHICFINLNRKYVLKTQIKL